MEQILTYFVELELSGHAIGVNLLLPLFSELTAAELEVELQENEALMALIM